MHDIEKIGIAYATILITTSLPLEARFFSIHPWSIFQIRYLLYLKAPLLDFPTSQGIPRDFSFGVSLCTHIIRFLLILNSCPSSGSWHNNAKNHPKIKIDTTPSRRILVLCMQQTSTTRRIRGRAPDAARKPGFREWKMPPTRWQFRRPLINHMAKTMNNRVSGGGWTLLECWIEEQWRFESYVYQWHVYLYSLPPQFRQEIDFANPFAPSILFVWNVQQSLFFDSKSCLEGHPMRREQTRVAFSLV